MFTFLKIISKLYFVKNKKEFFVPNDKRTKKQNKSGMYISGIGDQIFVNCQKQRA